MTTMASLSPSKAVHTSCVSAEMADPAQSLMEQEQEKALVKRGKPKRHITERRRMQGRAAQKKFREKQKKARAAAGGPGDLQIGIPTTVSEVSTHAIETTHKPSNLLNTPFTDELLGSLALTHQSQPWDTNFDTTNLLQPLPARPGSSSLTQLPCAPMPHTYSTPSTAFEAPPSVSLSIPLDTYIRVKRYSFHAACMENALILGFTSTQLKAHRCGGDRLPSPWFTTHHPTTPTTILTEHAVVPDLSPSEGQKKHDHDLYMDCLPFKDFRDKLLALRSVEPSIFDERDFIEDLDYRDAMQCWGPTPWEDRSWEVQEWFLRKWWVITGGVDGYMGTCSRWWRMLRGE